MNIQSFIIKKFTLTSLLAAVIFWSIFSIAPSASAASPDNSNTLIKSSNSTNWSGYIAAGDTYTGITGSWVIPTVSDTSAVGAADATWVGIGGVDSRSLIQAGTQAIVNASNKISYQAWYELLPDFS